MTYVAVCIAGASGATGLAWLLARTIRLRTVPTAVLIVLVVVAWFAGLYLYATHALPKGVTLVVESPAVSAHVSSNIVQVSGSVDPRDAAVTVMVRSEKEDKFWWIQVPATRAIDGRWAVEAHLGTEKEGVGQAFTVVAIGSADSWLFNLLTGRMLAAGPYEVTPRWAQSSPLLVWRTL